MQTQTPKAGPSEQIEPSHAGGSASGDQALEIRRPVADDGLEVYRLIADCPPLDPNSLYCNLLQCRDFADTSALAMLEGTVVGFVSGYAPPARPDTLFVWQVAVRPAARGLGLAKRVLRSILTRPRPAPLRYVQATVTASNAASWAMFRSLADSLSAPFTSELMFERERHFGGAHESEHLVTIGPIPKEKEAT